MEATGKIIAVLQPQSGVSSKSGKEWFVQSYVLETTGEHPKRICFEVFGQEKVAQFGLQMGDDVTIHFDLDSREWNGRWFLKASCFRVDKGVPQVQYAPQQAPQPQQTQTYYPQYNQPQQNVQQPVPQTSPQPTQGGKYEGNDLPF